jgi:hypothetical protein
MGLGYNYVFNCKNCCTLTIILHIHENYVRAMAAISWFRYAILAVYTYTISGRITAVRCQIAFFQLKGQCHEMVVERGYGVVSRLGLN